MPQLDPLVDVVGYVVDGNSGLPEQGADHGDLHPGLQEHGLVLPGCVEEAEVLCVDGALAGHVAGKDGADQGEGEGEETGAGEEQESPHVAVGKTDVVILQVRLYF